MIFKIYHATSFNGTRSDISDSIYDISRFGFERDKDYRHIIAHPTLKVDEDETLAKGDYIFFEIDDEIRMVTYIEKITSLPGTFINKVELWDVIKKLDYVKIEDFAASWFNSSSYWTGLSSDEQDQLYRYSTSAPVDHHISALFLVQSMLNYVIGNITYTSGQIDDVRPVESILFLLDKERLLFDVNQLKTVGKDASTDNSFKSASCLQILNLTAQILQFRIQWSTESGSPYWVIQNCELVSSSFPSSDDDGYSVKDLAAVDVTKISLKTLPFFDYWTGWSSLNEYEEIYPDVSLEGKKIKSITLPNSFEMHRLIYFSETTGWVLVAINPVTFLEHLTEAFSNIYTTEYKEKTYTLEWSEIWDELKIYFNFNKPTSKVSYLEKIT